MERHFHGSAAEQPVCDGRHSSRCCDMRMIPQRRSRGHEAGAGPEDKAMPHDHPMIAEGCFKPPADRLALRAPFVRGPVRQYLATEMEKAEIIAMMVARRPVLKLAVFILVLLMWIGALATLVSLFGGGRNNPTPADLIVMTVMLVAAVVAALHVAVRRTLRPPR
jgi:hypothetical protein